MKLDGLKKKVIRKIARQLDSTHDILNFHSADEVGTAIYIDPKDFDLTVVKNINITIPSNAASSGCVDTNNLASISF